MARYTIDGQILTDLGDVVRDAKFEINPKEARSAYLYSLSITETLASYEYIPSQYTKNKITILDFEWIQDFGTSSSSRGQISLTNGRTIVKTFYKDNYLAELPFSVILDGTIGFTPVRCESNVIFTIEPCDDNGELIKCTYTPDEIVDAISALPIVPRTAFELTDSFNIRFASNNWNWFIDNYGHLITTSKISDLASAFKGSKELTNIPFDLNISNKCSDFSNCFYGCEKLVEAPKIVGSMASSYSAPAFDSMFENCHYIRELPDDYFTSLAPHEVWTSIMSSSSGNRDAIFSNCRSLRKLPDLSKLVNYRTSSSANFYYNTFNSCYCLDEITNLPLNARLTGNGFSASSNMFGSTFSYCSRLKNITFEMNPENGNPLPAYWNKQTISLINVGWHSTYNTMITDYNSGITADKQVTDDASYQALKNDPDWWTTDMAYSRYNRASAVATINSLPDTTDRGGANTITFKGAAGSKTDGGAISDLTEAQIAVAAAKGWTVSIT